VRSTPRRPTCPDGHRPVYCSSVYYSRKPAAPQAIIGPLSRKLHNRAKFFCEGPRLSPQTRPPALWRPPQPTGGRASSRGGLRLPTARRAGFLSTKVPIFPGSASSADTCFVYQVHDFSGSAGRVQDFAGGSKTPRGFFRKTGGRRGFSPAIHGPPSTPPWGNCRISPWAVALSSAATARVDGTLGTTPSVFPGSRRCCLG
jgi:hypothetical protein